ncbi:MAG: hypothetical protein CMB56_004310 [Methanobacteriota archaeon]|nr:MAG: hypothetical protein CMB56_004310 [Euryarchaeota archaeon]|tara:strand:- start:960 stop:1622 length:663 start_codon:yes stop_codon:yes gene_type:complete
MRRVNIGCLISIFILSVLFIPPASSHDASALTTNIKSSDVQPNNANILLGDSVYWINLDSRENVTHRIVRDFDGDGLYNGTNDWDSGILLAWTSNGTCIDQNGSKIQGCAVTYELNFNDTSDIGTYEYINLIYLNGTLIENRTFTVTVKPDTHQEAISTYCFGDDCEEEIVPSTNIESSIENDKPYWLLYVSGTTGFLALVLGIKMIFFHQNNTNVEGKN